MRAHWISYFSYSRKKGDDYIHFLLNKFSAKNIFEKKTVIVEQDDIGLEFPSGEEDDEVQEQDTIEIEVSKLEPDEISSYVNSLKDMAKYWYDTFFPSQSDNLNAKEKMWIDRLNRIGIGHFRPLVMVLIARRDISSEKRIEALKAIERFIFVCFRMGYFNATFKSSEYYRAARSIYLKQMDIDALISDVIDTTDANIEYALPNFVNKIEKHFGDMGGFYYWNSIKYFLFEYELHLAQKNNLDKVSWSVFTKTEKDKLTIEHILPQTPTKYYWQNQFRQFDADEIALLSCALGNLLPLSQSINSALQNDSFENKKSSKSSERRGYENGSHSEIEVSKETDWTADRIYNRSKKLLEFMESRWQISFTSEQMEKLIYVTFAVDGRPVKSELPIPTVSDKPTVKPDATPTSTPTLSDGDLGNQQLLFWNAFVEYCKNDGRGDDIASRKPLAQNWYDIPVVDADFHISFTVTRGKFLTLLIYAYNHDAFSRLESKKAIIEDYFGDKFDWYSSKKNSVAKRILYKQECEIFNPDKQSEIFAWMIDKYDALCNALVKAGELEEDVKPSAGKFEPLKQYLLDCNKETISLSFSDIEQIIGMQLCKSAYVYSAYWQPSTAHILANVIVDAGYEIIGLDLSGMRIELQKKH